MSTVTSRSMRASTHNGCGARDGCPGIPGVGRDVDLAAGRAEVHAAGVERVDGHRVAQDVDVAVALGEALGQRLALVAPGPAAVDAQAAVGRVVLGVALDRNDVDGLRLVGVDLDGEAEVSTFQCPRVPSAVRMNAPLRLPTSTLTLLIGAPPFRRSVDDRLVGEVARDALHLADSRPAVLDHADERQVGPGIDPEPGACGPAPVVGALGVRLARGGRIVDGGEVEAEALCPADMVA